MKYAWALMATVMLAGCGQVASLPTAHAPAGALAAFGRKAPATADHAKAAAWISANAGGDWKPSPGKLFPGIDDGEQGLDARAASPAGGKLVAALAAAWFNKPVAYDPARQLMLTVTTSQDEPVVYVAIFDKASGQGRLIGAIEIVDLSYNLKQAQFHALFPDLGEVTDVDYDKVLERLGKGAAFLALSKHK